MSALNSRWGLLNICTHHHERNSLALGSAREVDVQRRQREGEFCSSCPSIGSPFAAQVLAQHTNNMGVMENDHLVNRGLQLSATFT